ncbi:hypothetical protein JCM8547_008307 [Rhodosporidiobolus lusitaniae]
MVSAAPPALTTLPVDAPLEEMLEVLQRDGGVIIKDFLTPEQVEDFNAASAPFFDGMPVTVQGEQRLKELGPDFHATGTRHLRGMLGKLPKQTSVVVQHPVWRYLQHNILKTTVQAYLGKTLVTTETSYTLSLATAFHVSPGTPDQVLHRDGMIHSDRQVAGSLDTTDLGCLIAGTRSTKANGATRVIPGSHLWGPDRAPDVMETVYAEMEPGSAMFWFGSTYHGASANTCEVGSPNSIRILYGVFGCKDYLRGEEAQHLTVTDEVARTLPMDVLKVAGWAKGANGCGFVSAQHPYEALGFPQALEAQA